MIYDQKLRLKVWKKLENLQNLQKILDVVLQTLLCLGFLRLKEVDLLLFWFEWLHEWLETISIDFKAVLAI